MSMIAHSAGAASRGTPVFLPDTLAESNLDAAVWDFGSLTAGANPVGAGGGLAGADLVLSAYGNPPASANGGVLLNGSSQYYTGTSAMLLAMLGGPEFSILHRIRNWTNVSNKFLFRLLDTNPSTGRIEVYKADTTGSVACQTTNSLSDLASFTGALGASLSSGFDGWFATWKKHGNIHWGFSSGADVPTGWDYFPSNQRCVAMNIGVFSGDFDVARHIVASPSGYASFEMLKLIVSRKGLQTPLM